ANFAISRYLFRVAHEEDSAALMADAHHLSTDVYTGLGIFAGLLLVKVTGMGIFDALTALGVALLIAKIARDVLRQSLGVLLDTSLPVNERLAIEHILDGFSPPLLDYHDLRTRKAGAHRHVDVHLTVPAQITAGEAHDIAESVEQAIVEAFPNAQVITHIDVGGVDAATGRVWRSD
ncbi:MAG TPA: cation diffusion facilitator family transporter, partial [Stenomitos sp.]